MAFGAVGANFDPGTFGNIFGNAMVGGFMSELQGGNFGHGFAAAGFSAAFKPMVNQIGNGAAEYTAARVATAAIIGGTGSVISGGKFSNGAVTGAMSQAFNGERSLAKIREAQQKRIELINKILSSYQGRKAWEKLGTSSVYVTDAYDFLSENNPLSISERKEIGIIYGEGGEYLADTTSSGNVTWTAIEGKTGSSDFYIKGTGEQFKGEYMSHTHGTGGPDDTKFSADDISLSKHFNIPVFMSNDLGEFRVFTPDLPSNKLEGYLLCKNCIPTK